MADGGGLLVLFAVAVILSRLRKARRQQADSRRMPSIDARSPVLDAWRRALDQAGPIGRRPDRALEPAEEVEDRESLEVAERVASREPVVAREQRQVVDLDDESRLAVARRLKESAARNRPHTRADHREFDAKLRDASPQPAPAPLALARERMREAMKWREILDRPVGWRDET